MLELDQSIHINVQSKGITLSNRWCGLEMLSCNNIFNLYLGVPKKMSYRAYSIWLYLIKS